MAKVAKTLSAILKFLASHFGPCTAPDQTAWTEPLSKLYGNHQSMEAASSPSNDRVRETCKIPDGIQLMHQEKFAHLSACPRNFRRQRHENIRISDTLHAQIVYFTSRTPPLQMRKDWHECRFNQLEGTPNAPCYGCQTTNEKDLTRVKLQNERRCVIYMAKNCIQDGRREYPTSLRRNVMVKYNKFLYYDKQP